MVYRTARPFAKPNRSVDKASRGLCSASRNMRKSPCGTFFGLAAAADISRSAVETRSMGWGQNISIPLFCIKHSKTIWIQPIRFSSVWFERYVRLESEYVRDDEADSFAFRRRVLDMRVSIAAFRPKSPFTDFFACLSWPNPVRAKPYKLNDQVWQNGRAVVYTIGPRDLRGGPAARADPPRCCPHRAFSEIRKA